MKVGFIGTGVMGTGMIKNLIKADFDVTVYNRTKTHADAAVAAGAKWSDSPKELASQSDVIISIVGFPTDVEDVYFSEQSVFAGAKPGTIVIDMTTSSPSLAEKIGAKAEELKLEALDAPVSGGDLGAKNGTLTIMVGGKEETYEKVLPLFEAMGKSMHLFGSYGSGQRTKLANQIMIAGTMLGMSETLVFAEKAGLNSEDVINTLSGGSAENWSLSNYGPRILKGDFEPGFYIKHFIKDLRLAIEEADAMQIDLPMLKLAKQLYTKLQDEDNLGNAGTQALIKYYRP